MHFLFSVIQLLSASPHVRGLKLRTYSALCHGSVGFLEQTVRVARRSRLLLTLMCVIGSASASVLNGPYVVIEDANRLSIRLELDRPEASVVLLHDESQQTRVVPRYFRSPRDTFIAWVPVDLATLGRFRGYEIWEKGNKVGRYDWKSLIDGTLKCDPRLLIFGDSQGGKAILKELGERWRTESFDLIVGLGDLVDTGTRHESWQEEFFEPLRELLPHYPIMMVCGNHEPYRERSLTWYDLYLGREDGNRFFNIDFPGVQFIGINNSDVHTKYGFDPVDPLTPQYRFLMEALLGRESAGKTKVLFCHVPFYSASTVLNDEFGSELQRRYLAPMVERSRVAAVFAGHHHKYERISRPGMYGETVHIVSGGGGGGLFSTLRARGGWKMATEVFGVHHYLMVDFEDVGEVVVRSIQGKELDHVALDKMKPAWSSAAVPAIWTAELRPDFSIELEVAHPGRVMLNPDCQFTAGAAELPGSELYRTPDGLVVVGRNLNAFSPSPISLQGYESSRLSWGYLQGAVLTFLPEHIWGEVAIATVNGADASPLDRIFPVMHWPSAGIRAGITPAAGALLMLLGEKSFDFDFNATRAINSWQWGELPRDSVEETQARAQWSVLAGAAAPRDIDEDIAAMLLHQLDDDRRVFVVRDEAGATSAILIHWPKYRFMALVPGESLVSGSGALFMPLEHPTEILVANEGGLSGIVLRQSPNPDIFIPLYSRDSTERTSQ